MLCFLNPKHALIFFGLALLTSAFLQAEDSSPASESATELRVLCYNIHHGRGMDDVVDLNRIANVILDSKPDVVALQEVDNKTERTSHVDQTAELGKLTGMHFQFLKQIDYEGGEYGQAILSKYPISDLKIHWLPGTPERERRIAGVVTINHVDSHGKCRKFHFGTTHLHHANESFRNQQAEEINRVVAADELPVILAGDYNATADSQCLEILRSKWLSATSSPIETESPKSFPTFPATTPDRQIDFILAHPIIHWTAVNAEVIPEAMASDHRPLFATLKLRDSAE